MQWARRLLWLPDDSLRSNRVKQARNDARGNRRLGITMARYPCLKLGQPGGHVKCRPPSTCRCRWSTDLSAIRADIDDDPKAIFRLEPKVRADVYRCLHQLSEQQRVVGLRVQKVRQRLFGNDRESVWAPAARHHERPVFESSSKIMSAGISRRIILPKIVSGILLKPLPALGRATLPC